MKVAAVPLLGALGCAAAACGGTDHDPIAVIGEWNEARNDGDVDRTMALVADDARMFWYSMADPDERAAWVEVLDAQHAAGWTIRETCDVKDDEWISCRYEQSDEMLRHWGLVLRGTHDYSVRDGRIITVDRRHDPDSEREVYDALDAFREWVGHAHPDLLAVIWSEPGAAAFTDRRGAEAALSLLDRYDAARTSG